MWPFGDRGECSNTLKLILNDIGYVLDVARCVGTMGASVDLKCDNRLHQLNYYQIRSKDFCRSTIELDL